MKRMVGGFLAATAMVFVVVGTAAAGAKVVVTR